MARGVARLGDTTFGDCKKHGPNIKGKIITASENTSVNERGVARIGDKVLADCSCVSDVVTGSPQSECNGRSVARLGDKVDGPTYKAMIITCATNVFDVD